MEYEVYRTPRISRPRSQTSKNRWITVKSGMGMCKHTYTEQPIYKTTK